MNQTPGCPTAPKLKLFLVRYPFDNQSSDSRLRYKQDIICAYTKEDAVKFIYKKHQLWNIGEPHIQCQETHIENAYGEVRF